MVLLEAAPDGVDLVGNPTPKHSSSFGPYDPAEWVEAAELTEESTDVAAKSVEESTDDGHWSMDKHYENNSMQPLVHRDCH